MTTKIVFIVHGHPDVSKGGAEMAAWHLFQHCKAVGMQALFVARDTPNVHGGSSLSMRAVDEILLHTAVDNWFTVTNTQTTRALVDLGDLLRQFAPDVIHVHHYSHIGLELFPIVRRAVPRAKLILTLHEYMAICLHNGQMVKHGSLKLCYKSSAQDCQRCFPSHSTGDFFLRKQFILDQFACIDHFISPSEFLRQRYVEWGISDNRISVIENLLPPLTRLPPRQLGKGEKRTRLAYFGQITEFKGLDILLEALLQLPEAVQKDISLDIHGAHLELQPVEYQEKIKSLLKKCKKMASMRGSYESHQLPNLMAEIDWVVVPSIWWENSPVVIQEAIALGRPLIVADIGGMREKVDGKAGLTFSAKSAVSLAGVMQEAVCEEVFDFWVGKLVSDAGAFNLFRDTYQFV